MKRFLSLLLVLIFLLLAVACASDMPDAATDPNLGVYRATTAEYSGFTVSIDDVLESGMEIKLKSNGKCDIVVSGTKVGGKWTLSGTDITVKGGGVEWEGSLENGVMRLLYGDDLIFNLEKEAPSASILKAVPSRF